MFIYTHKILDKYLPFYRPLVEFSKKVTVPGLGKVPVFNVMKFLAIQLSNETITVRASSIAFNFFLALVPALMFLFSLIPYVPIDNLDQEVFVCLMILFHKQPL